ncbi:LysR family transcriptional regulator, partial [Burkholderia cenocepacia]|uniref:LysR family transcriptional regulator n=1 Tax=Burkholderia cenocepacia TaxID=95486 RepID=UPI003F49CFA6
IKELEDELGVVLFDRNRRGTVLTSAGVVFLQDIRRLFTVLEQARENAQAVAAGLRGSLRIAISDGAIDARLSAFLARCARGAGDRDTAVRGSAGRAVARPAVRGFHDRIRAYGRRRRRHTG